MKWIRLHGQTEMVNLARCRNVRQAGTQVVYIFHTDARVWEDFDSEAEASIRFGQVMGLLGAAQ